MNRDKPLAGRHRRNGVPVALPGNGRRPVLPPMITGFGGSIGWHDDRVIVLGAAGGRLELPIDAVSVRLTDVQVESHTVIDLSLLVEFGRPLAAQPWRAQAFARVRLRFPARCRAALRGLVDSMRYAQSKRQMSAPHLRPPLDEGYPALPADLPGTGPTGPDSDADWVIFQPLHDISGSTDPGHRGQ